MTVETPNVALHIGAEALATGSGGTHDHVNPVSGKVQAAIPLAGAAEIERAVAVADKEIAAGLLLEHEGEVFAGRTRLEVADDPARAGNHTTTSKGRAAHAV